MSYINQIAYNLGRRDEVPNQELAKKLAKENNAEGIQEIAGYLYDKNKSIASDCLKVLYEAGYINPKLIAPYADDFIKFLSSKTNRMVWGAMIAIANIGEIEAEKIFKHKDLIMEKIKTGTVITNVWGVKALINMAKAGDKYYNELKPVLFKVQEDCRPIDFAKRAEDMSKSIKGEDIQDYIELLENKKDTLSAAGAKRLEKVIKKLKARLNK